jgi:TetR/AcrR family transcriptional regulator
MIKNTRASRKPESRRPKKSPSKTGTPTDKVALDLAAKPFTTAEAKTADSPEARILAAARFEFIAHGLAGARMRPIAQRAGVNPALLHYYFRNKDKLYEAALLDTVHSVWGALEIKGELPEADLPHLLRSMVARYFDVVLDHPEFPRFMLREIVDGGRHLPLVLEAVRRQYQPILQRIFTAIQSQIAAGRMRRIEPLDFFLNAGGLMLSSVLFALISEHLPNPGFTPLNDRAYRKRRTEEIVTALFDGVRVVP